MEKGFVNRFAIWAPVGAKLPYFSGMTIAFENQSDNLIFMQEMTVTEVARNFSAVMDQVAAGEEIVVRRGKVEIARIIPAGPRQPNGAALSAAIQAVYDQFPDIPPYDPNVPDVWDQVMAMKTASRQLAQQRLDEGRMPWES
ncbi:MAG: hypothetical protein RLZZ590_471 [Actinomycetota bacterium]